VGGAVWENSLQRFIGRGASNLSDILAMRQRTAGGLPDLRVSAIGSDFHVGDMPVHERTRRQRTEPQ
jgi:hypothetical protein